MWGRGAWARGRGGAPRQPGCGRGASREAGSERDWVVSARARRWGGVRARGRRGRARRAVRVRAGKGARPGGARVRLAGGSALELRSGRSRRVPPAFLAGRDRKWWRPRGEAEALWGRGPRWLRRPDRKRRPWGTSPGPDLSPTASHSQSCRGPLLPWAGRVRPLIRAVITGIPAGGGSFILRRGRGQEARAPGRKRLGQGQAPCGLAVQDEESGWACWRPQGLLGAEPCAPCPPLLATKVDTPVCGDECPSDTWGPASSG